MKPRNLRLLAAALVVTSLAHPVIAETLGEHPAVLVARTWNSRGIDPNTFIVLPPAATTWINSPPVEKHGAKRASPSRAPKTASVSNN